MKKSIFYFLGFLLSFVFIYLFIFIYFFLTLEKNFKYNFSNTDKLNFYKKYSKEVNHLRFKPKFKLNSTQEQLFTILNNS